MVGLGDASVTLWLDAHGNRATNLGDLCAPSRSSLLGELGVLATQPRRDHTLLIDDRRRFTAWGITEPSVRAAVLAINPDYAISTADSLHVPGDILVATVTAPPTPARARTA